MKKKVLSRFILVVELIFLVVFGCYLALIIYSKYTAFHVLDDNGKSIWEKEITDINDFDYRIENGEIHVGKYNGNNDRLHINSSYEINEKKYPVTAFYDMDSIISKVSDSVIFPEGTTSLGNNLSKTNEEIYIYIPRSIEELNPDFFNSLNSLFIYYGGTEEQWLHLIPENYAMDSYKIMYEVPINKLY